MFCSQCGAQIPDGSAFCPNCGASLAPQQAPAQPEIPQPAAYQQAPEFQPQAYEPQPFQPQTYDQSAYQQQQSYQQQQTFQQPPAYQAAAPAAAKGFDFKMPSSIGELFCSYNKGGVQFAESTGLQMKWYKALTAVLLYLGAASNLFAAIQNIFGISYGDSSGYLYSMYPGLRVLDIVYGIILIGLALVVLYIRMHLAQFKSDGPRLYLLMLLANMGISIVYSLLVNVITGYAEFSTIAGAVLGGAVMLFLNKTYFDKRQHLFTM